MDLLNKSNNVSLWKPLGGLNFCIVFNNSLMQGNNVGCAKIITKETQNV